MLEPETLDHLAPDDPRAQRSRRDLRRVNRVMGARGILARALRRAGVERHRRPLRILEIGCGDGLLMLDVARRSGTAFNGAHLTLLDRQGLVAPATLAAYAASGWRAEPRVADVLAWADEAGDGRALGHRRRQSVRPPFRGAALQRLLAVAARRADAFVACEPRRSRFALAASHLIFFLGANAVTRRDGVLSVRAGFIGGELGAAWPAPAAEWRLDEYDDGLFTHCFFATRRLEPSPP